MLLCSAAPSMPPQTLRRLAKTRKRLEGRRVAQLWGIAKALDDVARRELKVLEAARRAPDAPSDDDQPDPANHDPIDVSFVE